MLDIRTFVYSGVLALAMIRAPAFAGTQTVTNTNAFQNNTTTGVGGGAFLNSGSATASNSAFVGNTA